MDNNNLGRDQFIINHPTGKISIAESNGPREIRVTGVGEHPPNYADYWVDRTAYQAQLSDRLMQASVTQILAEGGFGKSSLAAWGFDHYQDQTLKLSFDKRVWVSLGRSQSFVRFARYVLQELGRPVTDPQANEESLLRELVLQLNAPNGAVRMLVVLDQVEAAIERLEWAWYEAFLQEWTQKGRGSAVLVTSRSAVPAGGTIALTGMNEDEGSEFLTREGLTGDRFSDLITLAAGHPLLLKLAASWTIQTNKSQVDDRAIDFFTKLFANYTGDPKAGVEAIFEVIFGALPLALQNLLGGLSVYRLSIDVAMAQAMDDAATEEDLERLAGQGLLLLQGTRYVLHPLVAGLVRSRVTEAVRREAHERAIGYFKSQIQDKPIEADLEHVRAELEIFHHSCECENYEQSYSIYCEIDDLMNRRGFYKETIQLLETLIDRWLQQEENNLLKIGQCYRCLGNAYWSLGDYQKAIDVYSQWNELAQAIGDKQGIASSLGGLGNAYRSLGDYQKAIDVYSQWNELAQAIGDKQGIANSLGGLGNAYYSLGDYQKAIDFHSQWNELAQSIGDKQGIATSLGGLGNAYYSLGDYQKAIDFHSQSMEIKQAIGDKQGIANSLGNLGNAYYSLGDYQKAIDFHSQHKELAQAIGDRLGEAMSLGNLGNVLAKLDEHFNALQNHKKAKAIFEELKLDHFVKQCQNNIEVCTQTIAAQRRTPPPLDDSPSESTIDWYEKQRQLNQPKTYTAAELSAMNRKFFLWFCVGIAIVLLIAWLKR